MALTRHATGNSRPRAFPVTEPTTATTSRKRTTKPKTKTVASGRITKNAGTTGAVRKHKPTIGDKVGGAVLKVKGAVEGRPGKKVCYPTEVLGVGCGVG
jgi:hypothetical protein